MSLLTPWSGFWLLVALIPILLALYILRLRRARQVVPSTSLWIEAAEDLQANTPFQRLRRNLLLALQLIALAMIGLALAQPRLDSAEGRGGRTVLLIDRSASMQFTDGERGRTRFEEALELARAAVDRLHPGGWFADSGGRTMIVALGEVPEVVQPFTSSRVALLDAIDRLTPSGGRAAIEPARSIARAWESEPNPDDPRATERAARIEVFTDGRFSDGKVAEAALQDAIVHLVGGEDTPNLSVEMVAAERDPDDPESVELFASILNWSRKQESARIQVAVDGVPIFQEDVDVPAGSTGADEKAGPGRRHLHFPSIKRSSACTVEVRLLGRDGLALDDAGWCVVPSPEPVDVLVTGDNVDLIRRALDVNPHVRVRSSSNLTDEDVDLLVQVGGQMQQLPTIPTLSFDVDLSSVHVRPLARRTADTAIPGGRDHAVFRGGRPWELWVGEPQGLDVDGTVRSVMEGGGGPLIVAWDEAGARRLHVGFDPAMSSWPWDPTFVTFLVDATEWLAGVGLQGAPSVVMAGQAASIRVPQHADHVVMSSPSGAVVEGPPTNGRFLPGPLQEPGLWRIRWTGQREGRRFLGVNAPVQPESAPALQAKEQDACVTQRAGRESRVVPLWPWAISAALLVLVLEWGVYCRRIR